MDHDESRVMLLCHKLCPFCMSEVMLHKSRGDGEMCFYQVNKRDVSSGCIAGQREILPGQSCTISFHG